ncbi:hypothetical protein AAFC00_006800 [Neodothiora populina]|uniref:RRM domain-containing protein n=1 Tax=Neodothiora populina TaxID=2781224 RepID=A0ABR3PBL7_9PEZI
MAIDQPQSGDAPSKRVYVGNLPYHAQASDIETYLTDAGFDIERLDLSVDPFTQKNPSYCFVELTTVEQAQRALSELPGASFMGRPLKVNVHIPRRRDGAPSTRSFGGDREGSATPSTPARTFGNDWRTPGSRSTPQEGGERVSSFSSRWANRTDSPAGQSQQTSTPSQGGRRVYVGNLPEFPSQENMEEQLRSVFGDFSVESISKMITGNPREDDDSGLHHYCFVDLADAQQAQAAIAKLDNSEMTWGGSLRVNVAKDRRTQYGERRTDSPSAGGAAASPAAASPAPEKPFRDLSSLSSWRRGN